MTSQQPTRSTRGFTLMELMITVALIGVLAAIAIPNFLSYQARARRSEAFTNLSALARAEKAYQAENNIYLDTASTPDVTLPDPAPNGGLGTKKMTWDAASNAFFAQLGWTPEGSVFYTYETATPAFAACTCTLCFTATAHGDVDGDAGWSALMYVNSQIEGGPGGSCKSHVGTYSPPIRPTTGDLIFDEVALQLTTDDY